jgi:hypothetical protein
MSLRRDVAFWVSYEMGCPRVSAPGVGPAPPMHAVCVNPRPQSCGAAAGGAEYGFPKCRGLGDSFLTGADPQAVNLIMTSYFGLYDGGYVRHVNGPEDCDTAMEGWYFEPDPPLRISVCPSTCACAKSIEGATFSVEVGCPRYD